MTRKTQEHVDAGWEAEMRGLGEYYVRREGERRGVWTAVNGDFYYGLL